MRIHSRLFSPNAVRAVARRSAAVVGLTLVTACTADHPLPTAPAASLTASRSGAPFNEELASTAWQVTARTLVAQANFGPAPAAHAFPLLGVAQYLAVQRAQAEIGDGSNSDGGRRSLESDRGAIAGASAVVLSYLFPGQMQMLEDMVVTQSGTGPGAPHPAFAAGEAIGRAVGAEIVTRAKGDRFSAPNTATPPVGPGFWFSSATPPQPVVAGQLPGVLPWFLPSASAFRPGPPPAFGSAEFETALAEIRELSVNRTAEQVQIALFWALNPGTVTPPGFWLEVATELIAANDLSERDATHLYALVSATVFDAQIACWDAKLTYWFIRPWQADPSITVIPVVGKPNHPSYPSGHSCLSAAAGEVLSAFFPAERAELEAMVTEAGLSRMYAGIHYRFDIDAGQRLGRAVARFTMMEDAAGRSILTPR